MGKVKKVKESENEVEGGRAEKRRARMGPKEEER